MSKTFSCKYCGAGGFTWFHGQYGWRLTDGFNMHECPKGLEHAARTRELVNLGNTKEATEHKRRIDKSHQSPLTQALIETRRAWTDRKPVLPITVELVPFTLSGPEFEFSDLQ
jgi:hypothetical protein